MMKILKILGLLFLIFIFVVVLILGYLGFVPGLSTLFGSNKPRDLGVKHTPADLQKAQEKLKQKIVAPSADPFKQFKDMEGVAVDTSLSQEEYSAHVEQIHPVRDMQIKLEGDKFEMSGRIDKARIPQFVRTWDLTDVSDKEVLDVVNKYLPMDPIFYIAGTGGVENEKLTIDLSKAEFGRLPVSTEQAEQILKAYTETLFQQVPGFSVENSTVKDGTLQFKGTAVKELPNY